MSELSLRDCENEVELARAKLARDLGVLRSPSTMSAFTDDLKREALDTKTAMVDKLKSTAGRLSEDLKAKAAANPAAALMIGAGIAWRLFRNPPIASMLVGAGLFSLWRTQAQPGPPGTDYFRQGQERLVQQASALAEATGRKATDAGEAVSQKATELVTAAANSLEQWSAEAGETLQHVRSVAQSKAAEAFDDARGRLRDVGHQAEALGAATRDAAAGALSSAPHQHGVEVKDIVLRGMANVALAAAVGVMYQKRMAERAQADAPQSGSR